MLPDAMVRDLDTFLWVADTGSFTAAADELGTGKTTVSRRVARLEEVMDTALVVRTARAVTLTDEGRALADRIRSSVVELRNAIRTVADDAAAPRGTLVVSTAVDFGQSDLWIDWMAGFRERYPGVQLVLQATNRVVDLVEDRIDVALRLHAGPLRDSDDLVARRLGPVSGSLYVPTAWSGLSAEEACGRGELQHIRLDAATRARAAVVADDYLALAGLCARGVGAAWLPDYVARRWLDVGELVRIDAEGTPPTSLSAVWLRRRHLAPRLRAFVGYLAERAADPERGLSACSERRPPPTDTAPNGGR